MDAQVETIEARLQSFLGQLQSEVGVLDRIVHKNKNQHRRSSYFRYLLKVRRDCKLLRSTNLEETVKSSFLVINGDRPKQKVKLLESLKRRKCDGGKHNFLVRLQGAARLLSQMLEPMLKAATSFFMGFSMTVLALLARLRVLTQQILLDVVSVFNMVSTLSRKQQAIKLNHDGIEVFREYYPTNEQAVFLECVWETDNFILLEKKNEPETIKDDIICQGLSTVEYQSIETILGEPSSKNQEHKETTSSSWLVRPNPTTPKLELKKKVAFISVKRPGASKANDTIKQRDGENEDPLFSLVTEGSQKDSVF